MNDDYHTPVLAEAVLSYLQPKHNGIYVDATLGGGGHTENILIASSPNGRVIGIDTDEDALLYAKHRLERFGHRFQYVHDNFSHMNDSLNTLGVAKVDGILFDLGLSSHQVNTGERGFSFQHDNELDMRMNRRQAADAKTVINTYDEKSLADIFWQFGEERESRRIARNVVRRRTSRPITTTAQLAEVIGSSVGGKFLQKSLARIFQAVRIEVNREMENLRQALSTCADLLNTGGRLVVISYHSLEDRIVKEFIRDQSRTAIPSGHKYIPDQPHEPKFLVLTKKPLEANDKERELNSRARSAKLRAAERM